MITNGRDPWGKLAIDPRDPGMSLRDYFAGQVLAGHFAQPMSWVGNGSGGLLSTPESTAQRAYAIADAMLATRKEAQP